MAPPPGKPSRQSGRAQEASPPAELEEDSRLSPDAQVDKPARKKKGGFPTSLGIALAAIILCGSAGTTYYFLTKPPETERLFNEGEQQLKNGQYAFALKTLTQSYQIQPNNPKVLLALARAHVGVDEVEKAWEYILQAQQLGAGVVADPPLATELANYYRQHNQFQRAVELIRPLSNAGVPGKKAELSDLDAMWGDDALRDGDLRQAMKCWEEVRDIHEGTRFAESETRLATIYQKIAADMLARGDTEEALKYYSKLNVFAPSNSSFEKTSELYERQGKLDLAIDQLRRAMKLTSDVPSLNRRLAILMTRRGKELLDAGDTDTGYGYLQQAQTLDPKTKVPVATIRNVTLSLDPSSGLAHLTGEVWNPGPDSLSYMTIKGELWDSKAVRSLWSKEQRVIDDFTVPLSPRESRAFEITSGIPVKEDGSAEFRVYLGGTLYKAYPFAQKAPALQTGSTDLPRLQTPALKPLNAIPAPTSTQSPETAAPPAPAPSPTQGTSPPQPAPAPSGLSPEEKTLRDLD